MNEEIASLRADFLQSFIKELITNTTPQDIDVEYNFFDDNEPAEEPIMNKPIARTPPPQTTFPIPSKTMQPSQYITEEAPQVQMPPQMQPKPMMPPRPPVPQATIPGMGKLQSLLNDPLVQSIECKGAGKPLLVRKKGMIQRTPIVLGAEEIDGVIDEFSRNTHIPVIGGLLKAAFKNLLITAVTSEFSGSRFVIQKKAPNFRPY